MIRFDNEHKKYHEQNKNVSEFYKNELISLSKIIHNDGWCWFQDDQFVFVCHNLNFMLKQTERFRIRYTPTIKVCAKLFSMSNAPNIRGIALK